MAANQVDQARIDGAGKEEAANPVTVQAMKETRNGGLPRFDTVQALMDDLHSED